MRDRGPDAPRPPLALACWAGLCALYEVLAGSTSGAEAAAGAAAALLATLAMFVAGEAEHLGRMKWTWWWLLARRLPRQVWADTGRVVRAAFARAAPPGRFLRVPFDPGGDDPVSGSRRALVTAAGSIAPNAFVARIEPERRRLLIHRLVETGQSPGGGDPLWPI